MDLARDIGLSGRGGTGMRGIRGRLFGQERRDSHEGSSLAGSGNLFVAAGSLFGRLVGHVERWDCLIER